MTAAEQPLDPPGSTVPPLDPPVSAVPPLRATPPRPRGEQPGERSRPAAPSDLRGAGEVAPRSPRRAPRPPVEPNPRVYAVAQAIGKALFRLIFTLRVSGAGHVPAHGPVMLVGNHAGFIDGPVVLAVTPRQASFLAKSELFRGWVADALGWLGQIPVDRGRADREALRRAIGVLDGGGALGMFPEGTRGRGPALAHVQHGVGYVAVKRPGVAIVPVACVGTERALPKGRRLPRFGTRVDVVFGELFHVTPATNPHARGAVARAAEEIRVALAAHVATVERERRTR